MGSTHSVIAKTNSSSAQMELLQHHYVPRILFSIHGQKRAIMWKIVPGFLVMNSLRIFGISRVCHFLIHFLFSQSFYQESCWSAFYSVAIGPTIERLCTRVAVSANVIQCTTIVFGPNTVKLNGQLSSNVSRSVPIPFTAHKSNLYSRNSWFFHSASFLSADD